jgi:hypothetical protein
MLETSVFYYFPDINSYDFSISTLVHIYVSLFDIFPRRKNGFINTYDTLLKRNLACSKEMETKLRK